MAVKSITSGTDLMLFVKDASSNFKSLGVATSHTLSISGESQSINSKDHGDWSAASVNALSFEITTENLYTSDFATLFEKMVAKSEITVAFGAKSETTTLDVSTGLTAYTPASGYYTGKVVITSLSANAPSGENATYSATFTGSGALTKNS